MPLHDPNILLPADPTRRAIARAGSEMRFEGMGLGFLEKARAGFLALATAAPQRFRIIDGTGAAEDVAQAVTAAAMAHLP